MLVTCCSYAAQRQRLLDDLIDIDHRPRRLALARERQQVADDTRGAFRLAENHLDAAAGLVIERALGQPLRPAENGGQRIVQLVGDTGNRLAERRHLFGLQQLLVQIARLIVELLPLADVPDERLEMDDARARPTGSARAVTSTQTAEPSTRRRRSR